MPARVTRSQGKSMFVKEVLNDNPLANAAAVNEAWRAAGMSGGISATLVTQYTVPDGAGGEPAGQASEEDARQPARDKVGRAFRFGLVRTGRGRPILGGGRAT